MSELSIALDGYLLRLGNHGNPVAEYLNPGLAHDEIEAKTWDLPFHLPEEVYELYQWRNGSQIEVVRLKQVTFYDFRIFLPLETAVQDYFHFARNNLWSAGRLEPSWFPIFHNLGRDYYLAEGCKSAQAASRIHYHFGDHLDAPVVYNSLTQMILTASAFYDHHAYAIDPAGRISVDEEKRREIGRQLNPDVEYWRDERWGGAGQPETE